MICGGGADAEENFSQLERMRSKNMRLCPSLHLTDQRLMLRSV